MKPILKITGTVLLSMGLISGSYLIMGFYILPAGLNHYLPSLIKEKTGLTARVSEIRFNPIALQFQIKGIEIDHLFSFEAFTFQIQLLESLKTKSWVIENITLIKPVFNLEKQLNGSFNIDALLPKSEPVASQKNKTIPITVKNFVLSEGQFSFQDNKISEYVAPINFKFSHFTTTYPSNSATFELSAIWKNGAEFNLNGDFKFSDLTFKGSGKGQQFNLEHLLTFIPENKIKLTGVGDISTHYQVSFNEKIPSIKIENSTVVLSNLNYENKIILQKLAFNNLSFDQMASTLQIEKIDLHNFKFNEGLAQFTLLDFTLNNLNLNLQNQKIQAVNILFTDAELSNRTQNTLICKLPQIEFKKIVFDLKHKNIAMGTIEAKNADFKIWLDSEGELNYQTLLPEDEAQVNTEKEAGNSTSEAFWGIKIDSVELIDFGASFEDKTLIKPVMINMKPLSLKLTDVSNTEGAILPFELKSGINNSGMFSLKGNAGLSPLTLQTQIDVNSLNLEKFQSYVDKFAHLDLIRGVFNLEGHLDIKRGDQGELDLKFKGDTGIARLITRDQIQNKDLVKWDNLTLKNIEADLLAKRYSIEALQLEKPYARVVIDKNKAFNFTDIWIKENTESMKNDKKEKKNRNKTVVSSRMLKKEASEKIFFKLDNIHISNGASSFSDLSMILPFSAEIKGLEGGASGISSEYESMINVTLKGNAYDLAPVDIKGKIQPFTGNYKAALSFKGMPLPLMSAYMAEFAGYKLENGKMSIGMNYEVDDGELSATNNLVIEQFELGEKINNPNAVDVPFDLAIALLKDMNGIIKLDVPITGSLNNPSFDFGSLIGDAILNVMTKVITSPFQAIASLLGTDNDLSMVQFSAGESELTDWQKQKLDGLAKVLREREVLKLEIKGAAFEKQDWAVLRETALIDRLKTLKSEEIERKGKQKIRSEYVELEEVDVQRLLLQEFKDKFPQLVQKSFMGEIELVKPEMGDLYNVARQKLLESLPIEPKRLTKLAAGRARAIAKYIVQQGNVPNERVFILDTVIDPIHENNDELATILSLKVN